VIKLAAQFRSSIKIEVRIKSRKHSCNRSQAR
jgi:hypothetical protein